MRKTAARLGGTILFGFLGSLAACETSECRWGAARCDGSVAMNCNHEESGSFVGAPDRWERTDCGAPERCAVAESRAHCVFETPEPMCDGCTQCRICDGSTMVSCFSGRVESRELCARCEDSVGWSECAGGLTAPCVASDPDGCAPGLLCDPRTFTCGVPCGPSRDCWTEAWTDPTFDPARGRCEQGFCVYD